MQALNVATRVPLRSIKTSSHCLLPYAYEIYIQTHDPTQVDNEQRTSSKSMASAIEAQQPELYNGTTEKGDVERRGSVAKTEKGRWERLWPVIACGAGLFSDGYLNNVRTHKQTHKANPRSGKDQKEREEEKKTHPPMRQLYPKATPPG